MQLFLLIYLLNAAVLVKSTEWSNVSLLAEELHDSFIFTCILEGNSIKSGVAWIVPIELSDSIDASEYFPSSKLLNNHEGKFMNKKWFGWFDSLSSDFPFKPVTDYRWEKFPITKSLNMKLTHLTSFSKNFNINISLRTKTSATLHLCNTKQPEGKNTSCILMGIKNTLLEIKLSDESSCDTNMAIASFDENEWIHLNIDFNNEKTKQKLTIKLPDRGSGKLTCKTKADLFPEQHLFVQSKELSLWKLHTYNFISLTKIKNYSQIQIGKKIPITRNTTFCISLHISLCPTCVMLIKTDFNETEPEENEIEKNNNVTYSWKEEKIIRNYDVDGAIDIFISVKNENGSDLGFWAIDDFRSCHPNEIRITKLQIKKRDLPNYHEGDVPTSVKCYPLRENPIGISEPKPATVLCQNEKLVGRHCNITCVSIFGEDKRNCERNVVCSRNIVEESSSCYCAKGYEGDTCKKACRKGSWGIGCKEKCGYCKNDKCNIFDGTCENGCQEGFLEINCTKPAAVKNLRQIGNTIHSVTIKWLPPTSVSDKTFNYLIKRKLKRRRGCKRELENQKYFSTTVISNTRVTIDDLEPYSEYELNIMTKHEGFEGKMVALTGITSAIDNLDNEEIPSNLNVRHNTDGDPELVWTEPSCTEFKGPLTYDIKFNCFNEWCKQKDINISVLNKNQNDKVLDYSQSLKLLIPYSDYSAVFVVTRTNRSTNEEITLNTRHFRTKTAVPPEVKNLTVYSLDENSVSLRWKPPYPPHGNLDNYFIESATKNEFHDNINNMNIEPTNCTLWKKYHCAKVSNLTKNSYYNIQVKAKNQEIAGYGPQNTLTKIFTQQKESEPPLNFKVTWKDDIPTLHWNHPDISNGPLWSFLLEFNGTESEISNNTHFSTIFEIDEYQQSYEKEINNLSYSTIYDAKVYAMNKYKGQPSNITIVMPPPTPSLPSINAVQSCSQICELKIPKPVDVTPSSYIYILVDSNTERSTKRNLNITKLLHKIAKQNTSTWLAVATPLSNFPENITITIGNGIKTTTKYGDASNKRLNNDTNYIFTVILENTYLEERRFSERYFIHTSNRQNVRFHPPGADSSSINTALYGLFALLLIPIAIGVWMLYRKYAANSQSSKIAFSRLLLPSCLRRNASETELLSLESGKPTAIVRPERLGDEVTPLLSKDPGKTKLTSRVPLDKFEEHVKESIGTNDEDGELVRQHGLFIRGQTKPWDYGMLKPNKYKNRYNNLIAYDHTRVKLEKINNDEYSDYINANYVYGYKTPKAYIATQGPKPTTVYDFWRMIWQEGVSTIVMVANTKEDGKKKSEQYWPNPNTSQEFGSIEVTHSKSDIYSNYVYRTLIISQGNEQRTVEHLHFTSWPDHGVPLYSQSLVPFVKRLLTVSQNSAPIVIHCSAGVGRTGTIILCDYSLRMAAGEGAVDFLATLAQMRNQRANLVDNPNQYKLAHLIVLEALFGLETTIACDDKLEQKVQELVSSDGLYKQMDYLEKVSWQDQAMRSNFTVTLEPENKNKNRFSSIIPEGYGRVYLSRYPVNDEHSDYINAVEVDGFNISNQFIVTQQPLPHTATDFWRMVLEKDATTIVSLNDIASHDESSCTFWPEDEEPVDYEFAKIDYIEKEDYSTHDVIKVSITEKRNENKKNIVNIVQMKGWPPLKLVPNDIESLVTVWEEVTKLSRGTNPTVVTCYDGAKASGVYVALSFIIEKIKLEHICDVCLAVRTIRHNRKQFVNHVEQFELLYKGAVQYLKGFETYSNFPITNK